MENCCELLPDLKDVDAAEQELEKVDIQDEVTDVVCDLCGGIW